MSDIETRFKIREALINLPDANGDHRKTVETLIKNGVYYITVNNVVSALASFSSAATYIYALQKCFPNNSNLKAVLTPVLGYVESLQDKTKNISAGGGGGEKKEGEEDWDVQCKNICEEKNMNGSNGKPLTFADVVGLNDVKETFYDAVAKPLVYPNLYTKAAKGILLYGPPGTGKTYVVKAAVNELQLKYPDTAKVLFFALTGADLKGKYVGETEMKIARAYTCAARAACTATDLYAKDQRPCSSAEQAKKEFIRLMAQANPPITDEGVLVKKSPQYVSVIFIDEFDSIGKDRTKDESGLAANAVNTLLQMMDGVESFSNVITVAATNNPWDLDAALLRRFNEQMLLDVPTDTDIKKLVNQEMKSRFFIMSGNKRTYCSTGKMSDITHPSQQLKDSVAGGDKKIKDTEWPLSIIDTKYRNDSSPELLACVAEMAENHYSNSDVTSVMQKAFNAVSGACLKSSIWMKIRNPSNPKDVYYLSKFTKIKEGTARDIKRVLQELEDDAGATTHYTDSGRALYQGHVEDKIDEQAAATAAHDAAKDKLESLESGEVPGRIVARVRSSVSATSSWLASISSTVKRSSYQPKIKEYEKTIGNTIVKMKTDSKNQVLVIPDALYIDRESIKSVFNTYEPLGKNEKEKMISSVEGPDGNIYVNIRFINDVNPLLLFSDSSIGDMLYIPEEVRTLNKYSAKLKDKKNKDRSFEDYKMKVMFTRVIKNSNENFKRDMFDNPMTILSGELTDLTSRIQSTTSENPTDMNKKTVRKGLYLELLEKLNVYYMYTGAQMPSSHQVECKKYFHSEPDILPSYFNYKSEPVKLSDTEFDFQNGQAQPGIARALGLVAGIINKLNNYSFDGAERKTRLLAFLDRLGIKRVFDTVEREDKDNEDAILSAWDTAAVAHEVPGRSVEAAAESLGINLGSITNRGLLIKKVYLEVKKSADKSVRNSYLRLYNYLIKQYVEQFNEVMTVQSLDMILLMNDKALKFMEETDSAEIADYIDFHDKSTVTGEKDSNLNFRKYLIIGILKDVFSRLSGDTDPEQWFPMKEVQSYKVFYFISEIKPLKADWVMSKAGGQFLVGASSWVNGLGSAVVVAGAAYGAAVAGTAAYQGKGAGEAAKAINGMLGPAGKNAAERVRTLLKAGRTTITQLKDAMPGVPSDITVTGVMHAAVAASADPAAAATAAAAAAKRGISSAASAAEIAAKGGIGNAAAAVLTGMTKITDWGVAAAKAANAKEKAAIAAATAAIKQDDSKKAEKEADIKGREAALAAAEARVVKMEEAEADAKKDINAETARVAAIKDPNERTKQQDALNALIARRQSATPLNQGVVTNLIGRVSAFTSIKGAFSGGHPSQIVGALQPMLEATGLGAYAEGAKLAAELAEGAKGVWSDVEAWYNTSPPEGGGPVAPAPGTTASTPKTQQPKNSAQIPYSASYGNEVSGTLSTRDRVRAKAAAAARGETGTGVIMDQGEVSHGELTDAQMERTLEGREAAAAREVYRVKKSREDREAGQSRMVPEAERFLELEASGTSEDKLRKAADHLVTREARLGKGASDSTAQQAQEALDAAKAARLDYHMSKEVKDGQEAEKQVMSEAQPGAPSASLATAAAAAPVATPAAAGTPAAAAATGAQQAVAAAGQAQQQLTTVQSGFNYLKSWIPGLAPAAAPAAGAAAAAVGGGATWSAFLLSALPVIGWGLAVVALAGVVLSIAGVPIWDTGKKLLGGVGDRVARFFGKKPPAEIEKMKTNMASRIKECQINAARYLLTRATHVGVCDGINDRRFFVTLTSPKKERRAIKTSKSTSTAMVEYGKYIESMGEESDDSSSESGSESGDENPGPAQLGGSRHRRDEECDMFSDDGEEDEEENEEETVARKPRFATRKRSRSSKNKTMKVKKGGALDKETPDKAMRYDVSIEDKDEFWKIRWYSYDLTEAEPISMGLLHDNFFTTLIYDVAHPIERSVRNNLLGWFSSFQTPEEDIFLANLMFADVFLQDTFSVDIPISNWTSGFNFQSTFKTNYKAALENRKRFLTQTPEFGYLNRVSTKRYINAKDVEFETVEKDVDYTKFLNFYMDPSFVQNAIKEYPTTYNSGIAKMLHDYKSNRTKFLEDYSAGKYKDPSKDSKEKKPA